MPKKLLINGGQDGPGDEKEFSHVASGYKGARDEPPKPIPECFVEPCGNLVAIHAFSEGKRAGRIELPDGSSAGESPQALVLAVGKDCKMGFEPGDEVILFGGTPTRCVIYNDGEKTTMIDLVNEGHIAGKLVRLGNDKPPAHVEFAACRLKEAQERLFKSESPKEDDDGRGSVY